MLLKKRAPSLGVGTGTAPLFPPEAGCAPHPGLLLSDGDAVMLDEIRERLEGEIERLTQELNVELPARIKAALELGDLRENSEYKSAKERQEFVQARLNHLTRRMAELSKIDPKEMAWDKVGFGSKVKIRDLGTGDEFDFTIVAGDFIDLDAGHVSLASPIGQGLLGAARDEEVTVRLPAGERRYRVLKLTTLPQQLDGASQ